MATPRRYSPHPMSLEANAIDGSQRSFTEKISTAMVAHHGERHDVERPVYPPAAVHGGSDADGQGDGDCDHGGQSGEQQAVGQALLNDFADRHVRDHRLTGIARQHAAKPAHITYMGRAIEAHFMAQCRDLFRRGALPQRFLRRVAGQ